MFLKSLILAGALQGLFLVLLLKAKKKGAAADLVLMIWLSVVALLLLFYYDNLSVHPLLKGYAQLAGFSLPLISAPLLYLYIYALCFGPGFRWDKMLFHLIPYLLFNLTAVYFYWLDPSGMSVVFGIPYLGKVVPGIVAFLLLALMALVPGFYSLAGLAVLYRYQNLLTDNFSSIEKVNLNWLKWVVLSFLLLFVFLFLVIKCGVRFGLLPKHDLFAVTGGVLSFYVFFTGYFGLRQTTVFVDVPVEKGLLKSRPSVAGYKNSGLKEERVAELFEKLKFYMEEQRPFLDEDLNLAALAARLDMNSNQLSQIINQKSAVNFFDFVNRYRVEAAKEKLKDPAYAHYSVLAIGYDCGFRSKASYHKIFKETTGLTPSQYQKS